MSTAHTITNPKAKTAPVLTKPIFKINPTGGAEALFREAVQFAADKNGCFSTGAATRWLVENTNITRGSAGGVVFQWSDPTDKIGVRRFRRHSRRKNGSVPNEAPANNLTSGLMEVPGWAIETVQSVPVYAATMEKAQKKAQFVYATRRTKDQVDEDFFSRLDGKIGPTGIFRTIEFFKDHDEATRLGPMFYRKLRLYGEQVSRGKYRLNATGKARMAVLLGDRDEGDGAINTEATNDQPVTPVTEVVVTNGHGLHTDHPENQPVPAWQALGFANEQEQLDHAVSLLGPIMSQVRALPLTRAEVQAMINDDLAEFGRDMNSMYGDAPKDATWDTSRLDRISWRASGASGLAVLALFVAILGLVVTLLR